MEEEAHEPKISLPEAIFVGSWILLIDAIEMIPFLNFLGDFWITDALAFPATTIYVFMKGVTPMYAVVGNVLELFPVVGWFPLRTLGFIITVVVDHNPQLQKAAAVADIATGARKVISQGAGTVAKGGVETARRGEMAAETAQSATATAGAGAGLAESAGGAGLGATEMGGAAAATGETAAQEAQKAKEIPGEALGERKEPWKKVQEVMENIPKPETGKGKEEYNEGVEANDDNNEINLKNAA